MGGVTPIGPELIEAMERKLLMHIPVWETKLLFRIDEAVIAALTARTLSAKSTPKRPGAAPDQIPVENTAGIKALMQSIQARKRHLGPKVEDDG